MNVHINDITYYSIRIRDKMMTCKYLSCHIVSVVYSILFKVVLTLKSQFALL